MAPISRPVLVPLMVSVPFARVPVITKVTGSGLGMAIGTTTLDGTEATDQPAPLSARTVKVYAVPGVSPDTSHDVTAARQICRPGEDSTRYCVIGKLPDALGASHTTRAAAASAVAVTARGSEAGTGGGGGGEGGGGEHVPLLAKRDSTGAPSFNAGQRFQTRFAS